MQTRASRPWIGERTYGRTPHATHPDETGSPQPFLSPHATHPTSNSSRTQLILQSTHSTSTPPALISQSRLSCTAGWIRSGSCVHDTDRALLAGCNSFHNHFGVETILYSMLYSVGQLRQRYRLCFACGMAQGAGRTAEHSDGGPGCSNDCTDWVTEGTPLPVCYAVRITRVYNREGCLYIIYTHHSLYDTTYVRIS
jgi:hypothetical protein